MSFLKKTIDFLTGGLLGGKGGGAQVPGDRAGLYLYVRPNGCEEVVRLRINLANDLSEADEGPGLFVHKVVRGVKCRQNVEVDLIFDDKRRLLEQHITDGAFVDAAAWEAWEKASTGQ
ncbi:MAG: hypothetical protein KME04_13235 [Pleurocapsa minor GSE-CHR-MK-17-07R]|jgi:hypothetical protein|nr:hypothetical protein [Pleurocapsa minor GSE-CHR-MK 17-07R]